MRSIHYTLVLASVLLLGSCKKMGQETSTIYVSCNQTTVGLSCPGNTDTRFSNYDHNKLLNEVEASLLKKVDGRKLELVSNRAQADYILEVNNLSLTDGMRTVEYEDDCNCSLWPWQSSSTSYYEFWLRETTLSIEGTLHNCTNNTARPFSHRELFTDRVDACYNDNTGCTEYNQVDMDDCTVLRKYGKQTSKQLKELVRIDVESI